VRCASSSLVASVKPRKEQRVVVAQPHGHDVSARFWKCWTALLVYDMTHYGRIVNGGGHLPASSGANITNARNEICRMFLDTHDADWLLFIDTDMTFEPDIVDRLVQAAHPTLRPVLGALCFSLQDGFRACPTIYVVRPDHRVGRVFDYPKNELLAALTGTGCLLIHRDVLVALRSRPKPYEWFQETSHGDVPIGEDITFCLRCHGMKIPVHVDTSIKCGHEKPFIVDEAMFDAQVAAGIVDVPDEIAQTFVVIPVKAGEREEMTAALVHQLGDYPILLDDSESTITDKWNAGWDWAEKEAGGRPFNLAVLNNDIEVEPDFLDRLAAGLRQREDIWISFPNVHGLEIPDRVAVPLDNPTLAGQTISGHAFMVRGECGLRFDPQFRWWYSDSDIEKQVKAADKYAACVGGCFVRHLDPMTSSKSPEMLAIIREDEVRFAAKWGLEPRSLWLALHPEFGTEVTVVRVALVVISDRGDLYLPRMQESLDTWLPMFEFEQRIKVDDRDHALGMSGAVNEAWSQIGPDIDYVFHVEEDWLFLAPIPLTHMCRTLQANPRLAQLVLQRQPLSPEEHEAGGVVGDHLGRLVEQPGWVEHTGIFSLNPCVYPASITRDGWPAGNEAEFTTRMVAEGRTFGFWGSRCQSPAVEHIGTVRATGWRL
jgi:hypothetical protein